MLYTNEKSSRWEEEQVHISVGLDKTTETGEQVEEVQVSLANKSTELKIKNKEAKKQTQQSIESSHLLDMPTKESTTNKAEVLQDLERVELAVTDAQNGMKSIKKQLLGKVRSMASLPPHLKMSL